MTIKDSPPVVEKPIDDTTTTVEEPTIDLSSGTTPTSSSSPPNDTTSEDTASFPVVFEPWAPSSSPPAGDLASDKACVASSQPPKDTVTEDSLASPVVKPWPPSYPPLQRGDDDDQNHAKCCRICLEDDHPQDMIAPCNCKGSSKWVHRQCLNQWRIHETDRAFSKCTECLFVYHLQPAPSAITVLPSLRRRVKYTFLVTRDVCLVTLYLQIAIAFFGWIVSAIDSDQELPRLMNSDMPVAVYYLCGFLLVLVIVGFCGMMIFCSNDCSMQESLALFPEGNNGSGGSQPSYGERSAHYQQSRQNYQNQDHCCANCYLGCGSGGGGSPSTTPYYGDPDGCCDLCVCCSDVASSSTGAAASSGGGGGDSSDCCNGCDGDGAVIFLFILLALAIILAIMGFVIGVALCVIGFQRTLQRHIHILHKRQLAREFEVMDLAVYDLDNKNYGSTTSDVEQAKGSSASPQPSAPTLSERDVIYLRDIGLME